LALERSTHRSREKLSRARGGLDLRRADEMSLLQTSVLHEDERVVLARQHFTRERQDLRVLETRVPALELDVRARHRRERVAAPRIAIRGTFDARAHLAEPLPLARVPTREPAPQPSRSLRGPRFEPGEKPELLAILVQAVGEALEPLEDVDRERGVESIVAPLAIEHQLQGVEDLSESFMFLTQRFDGTHGWASSLSDSQ
jgi:hypothetical protein